MTIKYVGPKVLISKSGVKFDTNKEDKYVYLNIALQLAKALDHEYIEDRIYTYDTSSRRIEDRDIYPGAKEYCDDIDGLIAKAERSAEAYVAQLLTRAQENRVIDAVERDVLTKNIHMMHQYIVQRAVNKAVYYGIIGNLAKKLTSEHIDYIVTPFYQKFAHVMHSIQGVLIARRFPINSAIDIYEDHGELILKLNVINQ